MMEMTAQPAGCSKKIISNQVTCATMILLLLQDLAFQMYPSLRTHMSPDRLLQKTKKPSRPLYFQGTQRFYQDYVL